MKKNLIDPNLESDIKLNKKQKYIEEIYDKYFKQIKEKLITINSKKELLTFQNGELERVFGYLKKLDGILPVKLNNDIRSYIQKNKPAIARYYKDYQLHKNANREETLSHLGFTAPDLKSEYNLNDFFKIWFFYPKNQERSSIEIINIHKTNKYNHTFSLNPGLTKLDEAINLLIKLFIQEYSNYQTEIDKLRLGRINLYENLIKSNKRIIKLTNNVKEKDKLEFENKTLIIQLESTKDEVEYFYNKSNFKRKWSHLKDLIDKLYNEGVTKKNAIKRIVEEEKDKIIEKELKKNNRNVNKLVNNIERSIYR